MSDDNARVGFCTKQVEVVTMSLFDLYEVSRIPFLSREEAEDYIGTQQAHMGIFSFDIEG